MPTKKDCINYSCGDVAPSEYGSFCRYGETKALMRDTCNECGNYKPIEQVDKSKLELVEVRKLIPNYSDLLTESLNLALLIEGKDRELKQANAALEVLRQENERYRKALDKISDPIKFMHKEAEEQDSHLDGHIALILAKDAEYLRGIAGKALGGASND